MCRWASLHRAALAACLLLGACLGQDVTNPPPGLIALLVRANTTNTSVALVVVTVSAPDIPTTLVFNIPVSNGIASGTITLPAGSQRTITLHAYDAQGVQTHQGSVQATIRAGTNASISIVLVPLAGDVPITAELGTFVITITPPAETLAVGNTANLTATIVDGNGVAVLEPVTWGVLNPGIASVASTGDRTAQITAEGHGSTTIVATYGGSAGSAAIVCGAQPAVQLLMGGFDKPLFVTQPPGDTTRLFIVEQTGRVQIIRNGALLPTPFIDVSGIIAVNTERGLLSLAFHPNYANNGFFYLMYSHLLSGQVRVVRYTVSADPDVANPASESIIWALTHPNTNHNGGLVTFGPDGYLYIGMGDGGGAGDPDANGQNTSVFFAKVLRIDVNGAAPYTVPADNPFVGLPPAKPETWVWGLRNPWRFAFDRLTGDLYVADVGQSAREEVNIQPAASNGGENYGWSKLEGSLCFPIGSTCDFTGTVLPVVEYPHTGTGSSAGCSITGGYVYRGERLPLLYGRYFFADFCRGWVRSFRWVNGAVTDHRDHTPEFGTLGLITSFGEDARGELYVTSQSGNVYKIVPAP